MHYSASAIICLKQELKAWAGVRTGTADNGRGSESDRGEGGNAHGAEKKEKERSSVGREEEREREREREIEGLRVVSPRLSQGQSCQLAARAARFGLFGRIWTCLAAEKKFWPYGRIRKNLAFSGRIQRFSQNLAFSGHIQKFDQKYFLDPEEEKYFFSVFRQLSQKFSNKNGIKSRKK